MAIVAIGPMGPPSSSVIVKRMVRILLALALAVLAYAEVAFGQSDSGATPSPTILDPAIRWHFDTGG